MKPGSSSGVSSADERLLMRPWAEWYMLIVASQSIANSMERVHKQDPVQNFRKGRLRRYAARHKMCWDDCIGTRRYEIRRRNWLNATDGLKEEGGNQRLAIPFK